MTPLRNLKRFSVCSALLLILSACGGENSSPPGSEESGAETISGFVEDGPITGAKIQLIARGTDHPLQLCGAQGRSLCETTSAEDGFFSLTVPAGLNVAGMELQAIGGQDTETWVDLASTDITLRAPLALFADRLETTHVNPVTTLIAHQSGTSGDPEEAVDRIRQWLGLPEHVLLTDRPAHQPELLHRSVLLTRIAMGVPDSTDPLEVIASRVGATPLISTQNIPDTLTLQELGVAREPIMALYEGLQSGLQDYGVLFQRLELSAALEASLSEFVQIEVGELAQLQNLSVNIDQMVARLLEAARAQGYRIPLGGLAPQRLARYLLFAYGISNGASFSQQPQDLLAAPETFAQNFAQTTSSPDTAGTPLIADELIAYIASTAATRVTAVPLTLSEMPGDDNAKRIAYYFGSDQSYTYQAERLIEGIYDDFVNDDIILDIVRSFCANGLPEEARNLIETQIFQSEAKAGGYQAYGEALARSGRMLEAVEAFEQSRELFLRVIDAKGVTSIANSDVINLHELTESRRDAGDLAGAQAVLSDMQAMVPFLSTSTAFGRMIVGTWEVVDALLEEGDSLAALEAIDFLADVSAQAPANTSTLSDHYQARVFYLLRAAQRYVLAGDHTSALGVYQLIDQLRSADGLGNYTGAETWPYVPDMAELLFSIGEYSAANALADSIPDTYTNSRGLTRSGTVYQEKAAKLMVTYAALNLSLAEAVGIMEARLPDPIDQVEALTYFASNRSAAYVAASFIDLGAMAEANEALHLAHALMAEVNEVVDVFRYLRQIQRGYAKIAGLYLEAGNNGAALTALADGEAVLGTITGLSYRVDGAVDLAQGYTLAGDAVRAQTLLDEALAAVQAEADLLPEDQAELFDDLVEGYAQIGDVQGALQANLAQRSLANAIFEPALSYSDSDHDLLAKEEAQALLRCAKRYIDIGRKDLAAATLEEALLAAQSLYVEATYLEQLVNDSFSFDSGSYTHLIGGFAAADAFDRALQIARSIPTATERYLALGWMADVYSHHDDFPDTDVASVDTDGDGLPDFFHPTASAEEIALSGLVLDDDSDGDGLPDSEDRRPLFIDSI